MKLLNRAYRDPTSPPHCADEVASPGVNRHCVFFCEISDEEANRDQPMRGPHKQVPHLYSVFSWCVHEVPPMRRKTHLLRNQAHALDPKSIQETTSHRAGLRATG